MNLAETIKKIIGREISWFDYKKLDKKSWEIYFNDAKLIRENSTFINELDHYIADLIKYCATMNGIPLSNEKLIILTNVQFGIVALETLRERLKSIEDPRVPRSEGNKYDSI